MKGLQGETKENRHEKIRNMCNGLDPRHGDVGNGLRLDW